MRLEILLTAVIFFGGAFLSGYALRRVLRLKNEGITFSVVSGTMFLWAVMELLLVPMTMAHASFGSFAVLYSGIVLAAALCGLFCWQDIFEDCKNFYRDARQYVTPGHLAALFLICYQLFFIHHHMYLEWDDAYYVNLANEAVLSGKIYWVYPETGSFPDFDKRYVLSLWPVFYAWLSKLTGVLPTIMAHTILPWLMIPLAYMVYVLIGQRLFLNDRRMQGMFLAFAVLLHLFLCGEHKAGPTFLSITPWVGKGVLAAVLIPALFYWILRTAQEEQRAGWILLSTACLGGCLLSSMGILLTPVFVGTSVLLISIRKKSIWYLLRGAAACLPCVVLGIYYICLTR